MTEKRRFGISIPSELADKLDKLSEKLGCDRSRIVRMAIENIVHDHLYYLVKHRCRGIIVVKGSEDILDLIEKYRDLVIAYNHYHLADTCIATIIVDGFSTDITRLHREILGRGCSSRYIPLDYRSD